MSNINTIWTKKEDQIIRDKYPRYGQCALEHLPGKTKAQLTSRAYYLGIEIENLKTTKNKKDKVAATEAKVTRELKRLKKFRNPNGY